MRCLSNLFVHHALQVFLAPELEVDLVFDEVLKLSRAQLLPFLHLNHLRLLNDALFFFAFLLFLGPFVANFLFRSLLRVHHQSLDAVWNFVLDTQLSLLPLKTRHQELEMSKSHRFDVQLSVPSARERSWRIRRHADFEYSFALKTSNVHA